MRIWEHRIVDPWKRIARSVLVVSVQPVTGSQLPRRNAGTGRPGRHHIHVRRTDESKTTDKIQSSPLFSIRIPTRDFDVDRLSTGPPLHLYQRPDGITYPG